MTDVLWIVHAYPWQDQPVGGVFFRTQAQALARRGLDIVVAVPTPWAPWPLARLSERWQHYASAPAIVTENHVTALRPRYPNVPGEPRWAIPDRLIANAVWRERRSWRASRMIHAHSAVSGLAAWHLARRAGLPFVITFHGSDLNVWPNLHRDRMADLRLAAQAARSIITVSAPLLTLAKSITGVDGVLLPLGSDHRSLAALAIPRNAAREALYLTTRRIIVLFVGNLVRAKGVRELADAIMARGERFLGVFVGDGPEKGYGIAEHDSESLQYRGARPHDEIARFMSAADVLVLPSHSEGLPTVLVEAGSLGLPVIASPVGGIPDLLEHGRGTLLRGVSSAAIGEALDGFERNRSSAEAAARRLREFVLAEHDVDTNAGRLLDVYRLD
jgi:teichuronic acid biosynthesis glycosyltransferase TuaC